MASCVREKYTVQCIKLYREAREIEKAMPPTPSAAVGAFWLSYWCALGSGSERR